MSFDWADYLKLADELCAKPFSSRNTEAKRRSAISRAYYAAFGRSREHLRRRDRDWNIPTGPEAHEYVRLKFERSPNRTRRRVASNLARLLDERNKADYNDVIKGLGSLSRMAIKLADQVMQDLDSL